jgi:hypothetical protein
VPIEQIKNTAIATCVSCRLRGIAVEHFRIDVIMRYLRGEALERTIVHLVQGVRNVPTSPVDGPENYLAFMFVLWTMAENREVCEIQTGDQG